MGLTGQFITAFTTMTGITRVALVTKETTQASPTKAVPATKATTTTSASTIKAAASTAKAGITNAINDAAVRTKRSSTGAVLALIVGFIKIPECAILLAVGVDGAFGDSDDPQTSLGTYYYLICHMHALFLLITLADLFVFSALDPGVVASGFANDGQDVPAAGQVPSLTSGPRETTSSTSV